MDKPGCEQNACGHSPGLRPNRQWRSRGEDRHEASAERAVQRCRPGEFAIRAEQLGLDGAVSGTTCCRGVTTRRRIATTEPTMSARGASGTERSPNETRAPFCHGRPASCAFIAAISRLGRRTAPPSPTCGTSGEMSSMIMSTATPALTASAPHAGRCSAPRPCRFRSGMQQPRVAQRALATDQRRATQTLRLPRPHAARARP